MVQRVVKLGKPVREEVVGILAKYTYSDFYVCTVHLVYSFISINNAQYIYIYYLFN